MVAAGVALNEHRKAHGSLHVARRLRHIKNESGLTHEALAEQTGLPLDRVKTYFPLFGASDELLSFIEHNEVPLKVAAELVRYERATNESRARKLTERYKESPLTAQEIIALRKRDHRSRDRQAGEPQLTDPLLAERFQRSFERRLGELNHASPTDTADGDRRIREAEGRIRNVTEAMAKIGYSEALLKQLQIEEDRLAALKADQALRRPAPPKPLAVPPERIQTYIGNLVDVLETDPVRGRERLGRHLALVKMTPEGEGPDRHYRASGAFNLSTLLKEASGKSGSGGEI